MSFRRYERYRDSGIEWLGEVPSHWEINPLFMVAAECDRPNTGMIETNLLSLSYGRIVRKDINDNDGLLPESFETYQVIEADDVVWRLTDLQNDKRSLRTALVGERGIITSAYLATHPFAVNPRYFSYLLRAYDINKVFYSMGGGLRQGMKFSDVRRLPIAAPPGPEQVAIAAFLDRETAKIDTLVDEQRRLIELLKEERQAVISQAVTKGLDPAARMKNSGVSCVGEVPAHWRVLPVKRVISLATSGPRGWSEMLGEVGGIFFQSQNIGRDMEVLLSEFYRICPPDDAEADRAKLREDDVVVCITGGRTGAVAHVRELAEEAYINQHVCVLRPQSDKIVGRFLAYALFSDAGQQQLQIASYGLKQGLSLSDVKDQIFAVPPIDEQSAIVKYIDAELSRLSVLVVDIEMAIALLQERRAALISAAVTGKIDVSAAAPSAAEAA